MRITILTCVICIGMISCKNKSEAPEAEVTGPGKVTYPASLTGDVSTDYFGTAVSDPYRWLEAEANEDSSVRGWVTSQNTITFDYLAKIPYRQQLEQRMTELADYPKMTTPYRAGEYYFYSKNDGLQNQYVTYYKKGLNGEEKVFLDPNSLSADGTVTQSMTGFSNDRKYVAISESKAGSDWSTMYVKDIANNKMLEDKLEWTKFSGAAWQGDGFYYSAYDKPTQTFTGTSESQKVFFHKLGTPQSADKFIQTPTRLNQA